MEFREGPRFTQVFPVGIHVHGGTWPMAIYSTSYTNMKNYNYYYNYIKFFQSLNYYLFTF